MKKFALLIILHRRDYMNRRLSAVVLLIKKKIIYPSKDYVIYFIQDHIASFSHGT